MEPAGGNSSSSSSSSSSYEAPPLDPSISESLQQLLTILKTNNTPEGHQQVNALMMNNPALMAAFIQHRILQQAQAAATAPVPAPTQQTAPQQQQQQQEQPPQRGPEPVVARPLQQQNPQQKQQQQQPSAQKKNKNKSKSGGGEEARINFAQNHNKLHNMMNYLKNNNSPQAYSAAQAILKKDPALMAHFIASRDRAQRAEDRRKAEREQAEQQQQGQGQGPVAPEP